MDNKRSKPKLLDSFVGCLLGLACGDSLGAPVEDWSREAIKFSLGLIRDHQTTVFGRGIITDDTMMAILLCESIIQNEHFDPAQFAYALGEWMRRIDNGQESARGVGKAVSVAGRRLYKGTYWKRSGEFSAGNASAVRVPPLALYLCKRTEEQLIQDAADSAVPTHIDPLAVAGTQTFALAIHRLINCRNEDFDPLSFVVKLAETAREINPHVGDAVLSVKARLESRKTDQVAFVVPGGAVDMMQLDCGSLLEDDIREVEMMGSGKFILQTLPAALYCFLAYPHDPESAILCAVNAGGDADTIGAMTGAMAGAFNGAQAIPQRWLDVLEKQQYLIDLSNMLYDLATEGRTVREFGSWRMTPI